MRLFGDMNHTVVTAVSTDKCITVSVTVTVADTVVVTVAVTVVVS